MANLGPSNPLHIHYSICCYLAVALFSFKVPKSRNLVGPAHFISSHQNTAGLCLSFHWLLRSHAV